MDDTPHSIDAFHRGRFVLVQPKAGGHRAGIDAMLLASCVSDGFEGNVADLGAGAGAAGFAVLSRCAKATASLFEASELMVSFAQRTIELAENAAYHDRLSLHAGDITADGETRLKQGLVPNSFHWVIANPPFNEETDRKSPHDERAFAHVMEAQTLERWTRTAASIAKPSGYFSMIVRPQSIGDLIKAYEGRFGAIRITLVHPRAEQDAIRILVTGKKGSKQKLEFTPPLILHAGEGRDFTARANCLINGEQALL